MIPRYGEWAKKYPRTAIIGVHTPEMEYERDTRRLAEFVRANHIAWPGTRG
jgi:hypothetical protein